MAPRRTTAAQATTSNDVPEGWELVTETNRNGTVVECYANVLGQKFYKKEDLMRYINYSRERGLSVYAPDFQESKSAICINNKKNHASRNNQQRDKMNSKSKVCTKSKKSEEVEKHNEIDCAQALLDISLENEDEVQCARALLQLSVQKNYVSRTSRRLAGFEPELKHDFVLDTALEYVLKEKSHK